MSLRFKEETIQHTFVWDEGGKEECAFVVRQPSPRDFTRLMDKNTKTVWDSPPGGSKRKREAAKQRFTELDHQAFMDDKIDFLLIEWGVEDADGKTLPCTRENKIAFDKGRPDITSWIYDKLDDEDEADKEDEEEDVKK